MKIFTTRAAAVALPAVICLVAAATTSPTLASADEAPAAAAAQAGRSAAPSLFRASSARDLPATGAGAVKGTRRLVTLDSSLLPKPGASRDLGLTVAGGSPVTARVDQVTQEKGYTSWTGSTLGEPGYFTMVEADGVYRGRFVTTDGGTTSITSAGGDQYWLTDVAPYAVPTEDDVYLVPDSKSAKPAGSARSAEPAVDNAAGKKGKGKGKKGRAGKSKVTVVFGYTDETLVLAGGKPQLKAAAALAVADTNLSMKNSKVKVKIGYKGLVRTSAKESTSMAKDINTIERGNGGKFKALVKARARKGADILHLFTIGRDPNLCGIGALPYNRRTATPRAGVSISALQCVDNLTPAHELGHNMGADHNKYAGVTHFSRQRYAYGYADLVNRFTTVMTYEVTCYDLGFECARIPYYSGTKATYFGLPTGSKKQNNAKAISSVAPAVARYRR